VPGRITRIAVTYTVDTPDGPRHTFHGLLHMQRYTRPERLTELLDDLTVICEELVATREPAPGNGLIGLPRRDPVTIEDATVPSRVPRISRPGRRP
jgi:hypothetical protein